ncbi:MAG: hypothetical protein H5U02_00415 [Clostridia bacterium]|nr:hypothetical protein [Clostridia bacterium]
MLRMGPWLFGAEVNWRRWRIGIGVEADGWFWVADVWLGPLCFGVTYFRPGIMREIGERILAGIRREVEI